MNFLVIVNESDGLEWYCFSNIFSLSWLGSKGLLKKHVRYGVIFVLISLCLTCFIEDFKTARDGIIPKQVCQVLATSSFLMMQVSYWHVRRLMMQALFRNNDVTVEKTFMVVPSMIS